MRGEGKAIRACLCFPTMGARQDRGRRQGVGVSSSFGEARQSNTDSLLCLPTGLGLMVLTTLEGDAAVARARQTIEQSRLLSDGRAILRSSLDNYGL